MTSNRSRSVQLSEPAESIMQFKYAAVLFAVFCAVQGAESLRSKRSVDDLVEEANSKLNSIIEKVQAKAEETFDTIYEAAEKIEDNVLDVANDLIKKAGINFDLKAITLLVKSDVKTCAASDDVKEKASAVREELLSCVQDDLERIQGILTDTITVLEAVEKAPVLMKQACQSCKASSLSEIFTMTRARRCSAALQEAVKESGIMKLPALLATNAARASLLAASVHGGLATCMSAKMPVVSVKVGLLANAMSQCVASELTSNDSLDTIAKAAPQLSGAVSAVKVARRFG